MKTTVNPDAFVEIEPASMAGMWSVPARRSLSVSSDALASLKGTGKLPVEAVCEDPSPYLTKWPRTFDDVLVFGPGEDFIQCRVVLQGFAREGDEWTFTADLVKS